MKRYLLIAGDYYYPRSGINDWVGVFDTYELAKECVSLETSGNTTLYSINYKNKNGLYDWYEIVDLNQIEQLLD